MYPKAIQLIKLNLYNHTIIRPKPLPTTHLELGPREGNKQHFTYMHNNKPLCKAWQYIATQEGANGGKKEKLARPEN